MMSRGASDKSHIGEGSYIEGPIVRQSFNKSNVRLLFANRTFYSNKNNNFDISINHQSLRYKIMSKKIYSRPITIKDANEFVKQHHRHHRPTSRNSGKWAISAVNVLGETIGVLIAGNPVSATYMDGVTLEITRLCVIPGSPKGTCSFLLGKCRKIWHTMGGERILTYTLDEESGASLRGAGWEKTATVHPHKRWTNKNKFDGLLRDDLEIYSKKKLRWECNLKEAV